MTSLVLAAATTQVVAVVLFAVAAVLAGMSRSWPICLVAAGLAALYWPW